MVLTRNVTEVNALLQRLRELLHVTNTTVSNAANAIQTTTATPEPVDEYDHDGAVKYIVCTVIVYSVMGVFFSLLVRVRRKSSDNYIKNQDDLVAKYLKMERTLKFEGDKRHMRNEIQKHSDSIARFEEKMRLIELERELELEGQMAEDGDLYRKRHSKKDKKRKSFSFMPRRESSSHHHGGKRKMSMMDNTLGKMGFSFLFLQTGNSNVSSKNSLQSIGEVEETDIDSMGQSDSNKGSVPLGLHSKRSPLHNQRKRSHPGPRASRLLSENDDHGVEMKLLSPRASTPETVTNSDDCSSTIESPKSLHPIIPKVLISPVSTTSEDSIILPIDGNHSSSESLSGVQNSGLHATHPNVLSSSL